MGRGGNDRRKKSETVLIREKWGNKILRKLIFTVMPAKSDSQ